MKFSMTGPIKGDLFSGGGSRSTWRDPPTMGKQLVNFITCGCESNATFFNFQSRARTHTVYGSSELGSLL
jgi:hypothetical protein